MLYQFRRDVTVEGVPHASGDIIDETEIPVGSLESLVATWLDPYTPPAIETVVTQTAEPTPKAAVSAHGHNRNRHGKK